MYCVFSHKRIRSPFSSCVLASPCKHQILTSNIHTYIHSHNMSTSQSSSSSSSSSECKQPITMPTIQLTEQEQRIFQQVKDAVSNIYIFIYEVALYISFSYDFSPSRGIYE